MRNYDENLNNKIKISLQQAYDILNKDKEPEKKYALFDGLADQYLAKGEVRDYPKVVAINQYMMKLQPDKKDDLERKIASVEEEFIKKANGPGPNRIQKVKEYKKRLEEFRGVENSEQYGESVRAKLKRVEDLGIKEGQDELDEVGLEKRAEEVEKIYMDIREFFIGEGGLIKNLISDCIEDLGGLPKVKKGTPEEREVEYAIFGMGSMALGTMTPWSDMEFGILIEDGLGDEEKVVKEYFRNLTSLLHIRVINFGETPLRMMGIEELNNFKSGKSEDDWFFDELINSGFSFDGPHAHACKTPLGRQGFKDHKDFELIGTLNELLKFQEDKWFKLDQELSQSLSNVFILMGCDGLHNNPTNGLSKNKLRNLLILYEDSKKYDPTTVLHDYEGKLFDVKKEIYRFPDRILVAIGGYYGVNGKSQWDLIEKMLKRGDGNIDKESAMGLKIGLSIACELRLRTYSHNIGQEGKFSSLKSNCISVEQNEIPQELKKYFHFANITLLIAFFHFIALLERNIDESLNHNEINLSKISLRHKDNYISGLTFHRLMDYKNAIKYWNEELTEHEDKLIKNPIYIASILKKLSSAHYAMKNFKKQKEYLTRALGIFKDKYGENHIEVVDTLNKLGLAYGGIDDYQKQIEVQLLALKIDENVLGKGHTHTAMILVNLSMAFNVLSQHKKQIDCLKRALGIFEKVYGKGHRDVAASLHNLAQAYGALGQYDKSIEYYERSLLIKKMIFGNEHPEIATTLNGLGVIYGEFLGNHSKQTEYYIKAKSILMKVYEEDHPDVVKMKMNLENVHGKSGSYYGNAIKNYENILEKCKGIYGEEHSEVAMVLVNLGELYSQLIKHEKAIECYKHARVIYERVCGQNSHYVAHISNNLGSVHEKISKHRKAIEYYLEALDIYKKVYGEEHYHVAAVLNNLGNAYGELDSHSIKLDYLLKALDLYKKIYGEEHHHVATVLNNLGNVYGMLGKYDVRIDLQKNALAIREKVFGENHKDVASTLNNLGEAYGMLGQYNEKISLQKRSLTIREKIFGENHLDVARVLSNLGNAYGGLGDKKNQIKYQERALVIFEKEFKDHPDVARILNNLGNAYGDLGDKKNQIKYQERALVIYKKELGDNHVYVGSILVALGNAHLALKRNDQVTDCYMKAISIYEYQINNERCNNKNAIISTITNLYSSCANLNYDIGKLDLAISCYEALSEKLLPQNRGVKQNLACMYHAKAMEEKNKNQIGKFDEFLGKARETFEESLTINSDEIISASLYVEYAQFLEMYHNKSDVVEYKKIVELLENAIRRGDDGSALGYGKIERETVVAPLQGMIDVKGEINVKPHSLACYLLCKAHLIHSNYHRARGALAEFLKIEEKTEVCEKLYKSAKQEVAATVIQKSWREYIKKRESEISVAGQTIH